MYTWDNTTRHYLVHALSMVTTPYSRDEIQLMPYIGSSRELAPTPRPPNPSANTARMAKSNPTKRPASVGIKFGHFSCVSWRIVCVWGGGRFELTPTKWPWVWFSFNLPFTPCTIIHFVPVSAKFGIYTVVGLKGTLVETKIIRIVMCANV